MTRRARGLPPGRDVMTTAPKLDPLEIVHADFLAAAGPGSTLPSHGPEIAFAGRSNVGKSSLLNAITGRKSLARVGATPGVTRSLVQFSARTRDGHTFVLVDLPGYGFAQRSKSERRAWADLIEGYIERRRELALVVLLVDARRGIEQEEIELLDFLRTIRNPADRAARSGPSKEALADRDAEPEGDGAQAALMRPGASSPNEGGTGHVPVVIVGTKIDKLKRSEQRAVIAGMKLPQPIKVMGFSSVTGQGKSELVREMALALERSRMGR